MRDPHKNPTISVLLCASKGDEVMEYALSRSLSPALIAEYQTQLPDRRLLQQKLHEFYQLNLSDAGGEAGVIFPRSAHDKDSGVDLDPHERY